MILRALRRVLFGPRLQHALCTELEACGAEVRVCRWLPWVGGMLAGMRRSAAAVTIGRVIVLAKGCPVSRRLLRHELEHVHQWRGDLLFPLRYTLASIRHGYQNNPYERAARAAELEPWDRPMDVHRLPPP